ncbi:hypothetical protein CcCBS67573_g06380 [Chytriomyces confervae]|uniref:Uncharacterized protein n=1 Tax=Chytriomyces confervae TaxID=246404 RepID=A0A507F3Z3_9FUNG|nr:hypothetical protein CcCBS67573_g06380 [Chytriomyces confervae]
MKTRLAIAIGVCALVLLSALFQYLSFYNYTDGATISSAPSIAAEDRISPQTFKQLADFYFGYDSSASAHPTPLTQNSSIETMIPNRSVFFVNSWEMQAFIEKILPRISVSIVLVTGDTTGVSMPLGVLGTQETAKLAADRRILRWFTMNCDEGAQTFAHKIKCIPIGVNSYIDSLILLQELHQEGVGLVGGGIKQNLRTHKPAGKNTLLVSFNTFTNEAVREPVFRLFCGDAGDGISNGMASQMGCA